MKTHNILYITLLLVVLILASCREITVTTKVNTDGTFTRFITVTGDSAEAMSRDLPFPADETWSRSFSKDTVDTAKYVMVYSKSFKNSNILNLEIKKDTSQYSYLDKNISVTKKSGFFFSYLTFKEVYKCVNPFTSLDYRKYVSEDDIRLSNGTEVPLTPADSARQKEAEDNVLDYLVKSAVAELESITRDGIKKLDDERLNREDLAVYHDSLCAELARIDFKKGEDVLDLYSKWSGTDEFLKLKTLQPSIYQDFDRKLTELDTLLGLSGYQEVVDMPGLITGTNSAKLYGNQVSWDFQVLPLMVRDTEFFAESRVINYWGFILSGIVLLAMITLLIIKSFKK